MSKTIPIGTYTFNKIVTDLPSSNTYNIEVSSAWYLQNVGYGVGINSGLNPSVTISKNPMTQDSEIIISFGKILVNDVYYTFRTACSKYASPDDYWWYGEQDATRLNPANDDQAEKIRTIDIEVLNTVDDDFYEWFMNNTSHEEEPKVQLNAPYLQVYNNFVECYVDRRAETIRFYKQTGSTQNDYEFFASVPVTDSYMKVPMNEYITTENTSFTIKAYCDDTTGNYYYSEFSNIVNINRYKNTYLNVTIKSDAGLIKSKISLTADDILYEEEKNYSGEDVIFSFTFASFNEHYVSMSFEIFNTANNGYHILGGDKISYSNSLEYNKTTNLIYNVKPIADVPSYSFFLYNSNNEEINEYISTQKITKIDLQQDTIKLIYVDYEVNITNFLLYQTTFIGIDKSLDNVNPEYKVFNTYDVDISSTVKYYVSISNPDNVLIYLFNNKSESNRLDKSKYLENIDELHGSLREECNIIDPVISLELSNPPTFNYVYIPSFNRYYFVKEFDFIRTGLYRLKLHVDVLMSYKDAIRNLECLIERNEYKYNKYISTRIPTKNDTEIKEYVVELPEATNRALFTIYDTSRKGYHLPNKDYYGDCNIVIQLLAAKQGE